MSLKSFFKESAQQPENVRVAISDRFHLEDGTPEMWELRPISETENSAIRSQCTKKTLVKGGGRMATHFDGELYVQRLAAASVVYPDLSNAELQGSYKVVGEAELLIAMLMPGEMTLLQNLTRQLNGYDEDKLSQSINDVKNS